ncbi:MAG: endo-1,4-beta-xylanase [Bacteroidales bacterium]|nr:endo-1,4-beta-xylanase [Bacteroidales bacterium]
MNKINFIYFIAAILVAATLFSSCGGKTLDPDPDPYDTEPATPVDKTPKSVYKYGLRELAQANGLLIGAEYTYSEYAQDDSLRVVLKRDFEAVTFGNEMKHDNIVAGDGALVFNRADQMAQWAKDCGLKLFGHTLGWHNQQQSDYLNALISGAKDADEAAALVRKAHKTWVEAMVKHFDVYGWDVVNEVFSDSGDWRSSANTSTKDYHQFLWGSYYSGGTKAFVDSAFRNAREALERNGKTADLYINDYSLEWLGGKLEAICNYAQNNPDVTGIGTQMHISADVPRDNIKTMLERMVKTGKKVRISELDVTLGTADQAETIVYIFDQYLKIVPEAQRGGISFWGVSDKNSWLGYSKEPLLYSYSYRRKDAYLKLHAYLLERSGLDKN